MYTNRLENEFRLLNSIYELLNTSFNQDGLHIIHKIRNHPVSELASVGIEQIYHNLSCPITVPVIEVHALNLDQLIWHVM